MSAVTRELSRGRSGLPRSPHINGAGRVNRTLVGEVQALCTATVLDQQTFGAGTQPRTAVGAYHAPALPVELYQRSWRGDTITPASRHQACRGTPIRTPITDLRGPRSFPLSYTSTNSGERRVSAVAREPFARAQQRSVAEPSKYWRWRGELHSR